MPEAVVRRETSLESVAAQDGALVKEYFGIRDRITHVGTASGVLPPGRKAVAHRHQSCDEIYIVTAGTGRVHLGARTHAISAGDQVYIPKGVMHALENDGTEPLSIICVSVPAFQPGDFLIPDDSAQR